VAAVDVELRGDIRAVRFDGAVTDAEVVGDFLARLVERNELQNALFSSVSASGGTLPVGFGPQGGRQSQG
jgi:hypothetical protein